MAGIYIHVPFCQSRCIYCDFYSTTLPASWHMPYVEAVAREMQMRADHQPVPTLYIGGGTPSQLSVEALRRLFGAVADELTLVPNAEVTIEANPDDITPQWIEALRQTPVNRISMGIQSLSDPILRTLRRRHSAQQALRAIDLLQQAGYHNISADLIYGLPGQSLRQFTDDVSQLISLGIPHLSAYALQFEEGTALMAMKQAGTLSEADEELSLACYERLIDLTAEAGLEHYEISNFARPGFRSRHNSSYWTMAPYIGLGAGAHSYRPDCATRSYNCEDAVSYIATINNGSLPSTAERLTNDDRYNELVMLSLRTCEGLSLSQLEHQFGRKRLDYCLHMAKGHIDGGRLRKTADEALCLTRRGLFVSDDIISDLMV